MAAGLREELLAHRPRETSGSSASNRFAYQRNWTLCHLLALHQTDQQYLILLEFHDDLIVIDEASTPEAVEFFQVKTRGEGHWGQRDLTRVKGKTKKAGRGGKPAAAPPSVAVSARSIIGKLMEHCIRFRDCLPQVKALTLVSNANFNLALEQPPPSNTRSEFCLSELEEGVLKQLEQTINIELGTKDKLPWERVKVRVTPLSLLDHETHALGLLTKFLGQRNPDVAVPPVPLFKALTGELALRGNCEWQPSSFDELKDKKGISRADFEGFLRLAEEQPRPKDLLKSALAQLQQEGHSYRELTELEEAWRRYDLLITNQADIAIQTIKTQVSNVAREARSSGEWSSLVSLLKLAHTKFINCHGPLPPPNNTRFLQGALLYELKLEEARESSQAHSQHTAGKS